MGGWLVLRFGAPCLPAPTCKTPCCQGLCYRSEGTETSETGSLGEGREWHDHYVWHQREPPGRGSLGKELAQTQAGPSLTPWRLGTGLDTPVLRGKQDLGDQWWCGGVAGNSRYPGALRP